MNLNLLKRLNNRNYILFEKLNDFWIFQDEENKIACFVNFFESIQLKNLELIINNMKKIQIFHIILVFTKSVSPIVKNKIWPNFQIELICSNSLEYDIMDHVKQPKFIKCNKIQKEHVLKLHTAHLPQLLLQDPVSLYLNFKKGDVIAICREKCLNNLNEKGFCCEKTNFRIVV